MTSEIDSSFAALNINRHVFDDTDNIRTYEKDFKRNNPSEVQSPRHSPSSSELKNIFAKFDVASKQISPEILEKTRDLCAKYLGGAWTKISSAEFHVKAITGGMSNLLFLVNLPSHVKPIGTEPDSALLRIHGQSDVEQLLSESVIFTMLSERHLGPKLLGVFPGGRFEQFIPSRCLQCEEIAYPTMSSIVGNLLARVHTLDVPITKEPNMIALAESWLSKLRLTESGRREWELKPVKAKVDMEALPATFSCESLAKEMALVKRCLSASGSPIVFCHNDLQEGNVLLYNKFEYTSEGTLRNTVPLGADEEPLVLIDFEYASYNYRGFDLGNHFCEYGIDYDCNEPPCYKIHNERFPSSEERRRFLSAYIDEVYKLRDSDDNPHFPLDLVTGDKEKDLETLVEESLRFMGVSHFFWTIWSLLQAEEGIVEDFDFHSYALDRLSLYFHNKKNLLKYVERD